jgi:hypothetical protein
VDAKESRPQSDASRAIATWHSRLRVIWVSAIALMSLAAGSLAYWLIVRARAGGVEVGVAGVLCLALASLRAGQACRLGRATRRAIRSAASGDAPAFVAALDAVLSVMRWEVRLSGGWFLTEDFLAVAARTGEALPDLQLEEWARFLQLLAPDQQGSARSRLRAIAEARSALRSVADKHR